MMSLISIDRYTIRKEAENVHQYMSKAGTQYRFILVIQKLITYHYVDYFDCINAIYNNSDNCVTQL